MVIGVPYVEANRPACGPVRTVTSASDSGSDGNTRELADVGVLRGGTLFSFAEREKEGTAARRATSRTGPLSGAPGARGGMLESESCIPLQSSSTDRAAKAKPGRSVLAGPPPAIERGEVDPEDRDRALLVPPRLGEDPLGVSAAHLAQGPRGVARKWP